MSGFLGIGGSAAKTDRKNELTGFGDLGSVFNSGLSTAGKLSSAGSGATGQASNYWSSLLTGNRAATQAAQAPAINATLAQGDAAKRQAAANGTARGGGTAGTNQQTNDKTQGTIDNALFAVRPQAAQQQQQIGQSETGQALQALGLAGGTAGDITNLASDSRKESDALTSKAIGQVASTISSVAGAFGL